MGDEPKIRVTPNSPEDSERAARLQRHYNWLYETNAEFRAKVDAIPTDAELLSAVMMYGVYLPPELDTSPGSGDAPTPEPPPDSDA